MNPCEDCLYNVDLGGGCHVCDMNKHGHLVKRCELYTNINELPKEFFKDLRP